MSEEKITISMEEYKELLIIKGRYEELKEETQKTQKPTIWSGYNEENIKILPCRDTRELQTTDPIIAPPYKITCKGE